MKLSRVNYRIKKSGVLQDIIKKFIDNGYGLTSVILDVK